MSAGRTMIFGAMFDEVDHFQSGDHARPSFLCRARSSR